MRQDHHVADIQTSGKLARGPVRRGYWAWRADPSLRGEHRCDGRMPIRRCAATLAPAGHAPAALDAPEASSHVCPSAKQQNQPCSSGVFRPIVRLLARRVSSIRSAFVRVMVSVMDAIIVYKWRLARMGIIEPLTLANDCLAPPAGVETIGRERSRARATVSLVPAQDLLPGPQ